MASARAWRRRPDALSSSDVVPRGAHSSPRSRSATATDDDLEKPSRLRFPRHARIADKASFSRVFAGSTRSTDSLFTVLSRANGTRRARLGLAISKKHCRLAVERNRLKRLVRESFRRHQQALAGLDVVVINRRDAGAAGNARLFDSLAAHWQRCCRKHSRGTPDG